jgi:phosphonate transport system substrate-binding protein
MLTRRDLFIGAAAMGALGATAARADDWKTKYSEFVFAVIPEENGSGVVDRWTPFMTYLSKELGVKATLRVANDYAAVIEGQRAGNIHIAYYGPASFARARIIGVKTDAFAIDVNSDGSKGYYSVFYVLAKSPYQKIEDLKGKAMGFVDPNSTSGNNMPRFVLNGLGLDPEKYFSKTVFAGSHENAVLALAQGTVDVCANWWNNDDDSNLTRMLNKGMLKNADGSPMKKEDFRIILKSDMIINSPFAYLSDLPEAAKEAIAKAFFDAPTKDAQAFAKLSDGKNRPWAPVKNEDYNKTIELVKFVDDLRKKKS